MNSPPSSVRRLARTALFLLVTQWAAGGELADKPAGNPVSDWGVEWYAQGGVVVEGVAYFASDDGSWSPAGTRAPAFHGVVAFDVETLRKIKTYPVGHTYDSSPFLFQARNGDWRVVAHEHETRRTVAFDRDTAKPVWTSAANQPGVLFFGYSMVRQTDGSTTLLTACENGLHALSGETGKELWWVKGTSAGGVTPCVDQDQGWVFYQRDGQVLKIKADDGTVLASTRVSHPNTCISWNTVLVNDDHGYFVVTRWYGKPEYDSAIRVFDRDLNLVWEKTRLPSGKKDTLTYAEGKILTGSGNHWSTAYRGTGWKYLAAYSIADGSIAWKCNLSHLPYISILNVLYHSGHFYAETVGVPKDGPSYLLRIRAADGALLETLDYGRRIISCATSIIARGRVFSGDLREDRIVVTRIAEGCTAKWPGPFGDPQLNQMAVVGGTEGRMVPMTEIRCGTTEEGNAVKEHVSATHAPKSAELSPVLRTRLSVAELRQAFEEELERRRIPGKPLLHANKRGDTRIELYGLTGAVYVRACLGVPLGTQEERAEQARQILAFQRTDGTFGHNSGCGPGHGLHMVLGALNLLEQPIPGNVGPLAPIEPEALRAWLRRHDWNSTHKELCGPVKPLLADGLIDAAWKRIYVEEVAGRLSQDRPLDTWCKPDDPPWKVVSCLYHVLNTFDDAAVPYPHPEMLFDRLAGLKWDAPLDGRRATVCTDGDWALLLLHLCTQLPERTPQAMEAIRRVSHRRIRDWHEDRNRILAMDTHSLYCYLWVTAVFQKICPDQYTDGRLRDTLHELALYRLKGPEEAIKGAIKGDKLAPEIEPDARDSRGPRRAGDREGDREGAGRGQGQAVCGDPQTVTSRKIL